MRPGAKRACPRIPAWLVAGACAFLGSGGPTCAEVSAEWTEVGSPHFVVRTNAGGKIGRRVALQFEQVRAVLGKVWPWARLDDGRALLVVAARDKETFQDLLPALHEKRERAEVDGVFQRGLDKHLVVLRADVVRGADQGGYYRNPYHTVYHEYVHLVLELNFRDVPAWLGEGLAEYWADVEVDGEWMSIGRPIAGHVLHLRESRLVSMDTLLRVDTDSPHYWERGKADVFYAQSWALVHFLTFEPGVGSGNALNDYAALLRDGLRPEEAAAQALPNPAVLGPRLAAYLRNFVFDYQRSRAPLTEASAKDYRERPLSPAEVQSQRGELRVRFERREEGRRLLEEAARLDPRLAAPEETLGLAALQSGDMTAAEGHLRRAAELESSSAVVHYLRGLVAWRKGGDALEEAEAALVRSAQLNHDFAPTYASLAAVAAGRGAPTAKTEPLARRAIRLEPGVASHRLILAQLLWGAGRREEARTALEEARAMARADKDRAAAQVVLDELSRIRASVEPSVGPGPSGATSPPGEPIGPSNPREAAGAEEAACARGEALACARRGQIAFEGRGEPRDEGRALVFFEKACTLDAGAGCQEAGLVWLGRRLPEDRAKAVGFFERACSAGQLQACHDLAHLYEVGIGAPADPVRARTFYEKACRAGYPPSCAWLKQAEPGR